MGDKKQKNIEKTAETVAANLLDEFEWTEAAEDELSGNFAPEYEDEGSED